VRKRELDKLKTILENTRQELLKNSRAMREDILVDTDDRADEIDQASVNSEHSITMRLRNREALYLKKIQDALNRIKDGSFGECINCGENIEFKRLMARPTASLCILCKEEEEKKEEISSAGLKHKSLGESFFTRVA